MNSLVRVFSNFKDFYNDINAATLTGAIDVIVVEQPDGEFHCSPFHVRFGKLGVLRSREKVVDIEINGAPVDIQMKLGDSGEAFFVEECPEDDAETLPENMATSPIPKSYLSNDNPLVVDPKNQTNVVTITVDKTINASEELTLPLPLPRRNSIDFSKEAPKEAHVESGKFENQVSDYSHRRHTDNTLERRNLSVTRKELTTQKIRQEWAEHEESFHFEPVVMPETKDKETSAPNNAKIDLVETPAVAAAAAAAAEAAPIEIVNLEVTVTPTGQQSSAPIEIPPSEIANANINTNGLESSNSLAVISNANSIKEDTKQGKQKKRRKKSQMKKKNSQRKTTSSGSSVASGIIGGDGSSIGGGSCGDGYSISSNIDEVETQSISISNITNSSSNDESTPKSGEQPSAPLLTANAGDESPISETCPSIPNTPTAGAQRLHDLDIHFFSDTEVTTSPAGTVPGGVGRGSGRPSTPIQSDSELETTMREKHQDGKAENAASWNWGELPTPEQAKIGVLSPDGGQSERQSMLSNMFSFMKKANKIRKEANEAGDIYLSDLDTGSMDPKMAALYFPSPLPKEPTPGAVQQSCDEDRESGNGTSLPQSPSSMEGQKSLDSDYDDGKHPDSKYLDFVAMSQCGMIANRDPTDEEFNRHIISYPEVCKNPSLFASPNLVVRLNGKYYTWTAACPIVMTIITFQKPLTNEAIEQLMANATNKGDIHESTVDGNPATAVNVNTDKETKRSWWYWRRSQGSAPNMIGGTSVVDTTTKKLDDETKIDDKDGDNIAVATQSSRSATPDISEQTLSKTDSTVNAENTSAMVDNMEDLSMASNKNSDEPKERYKKSLRLSSAAIKKLNLNEGMNLIEFSVTTAYQGTTRCKCYLFRWKHNDKVVISDIDGTITKSDVLGHILPMVGKDWAQLGVAQLFSKIEQNGYKLLYLSARAIGQSRVTREYLRSIRQGNVMLPDGPLLLNPTSLISAFHREVIEKKPEQFKIACLTDIRDLFPNKDPFYAGYGNRINDVWAYRAVGIPIMRIFTINTKGELKHELTQTFQSSYCSMTFIVDQLFPPVKYDETAIEFSNFNYWRDPIPDVDIEITELLQSSDKPELNATLSKTLRPIPEK